jgi:hypothetical protein
MIYAGVTLRTDGVSRAGKLRPRGEASKGRLFARRKVLLTDLTGFNFATARENPTELCWISLPAGATHWSSLRHAMVILHLHRTDVARTHQKRNGLGIGK